MAGREAIPQYQVSQDELKATYETIHAGLTSPAQLNTQIITGNGDTSHSVLLSPLLAQEVGADNTTRYCYVNSRTYDDPMQRPTLIHVVLRSGEIDSGLRIVQDYRFIKKVPTFANPTYTYELTKLVPTLTDDVGSESAGTAANNSSSLSDSDKIFEANMRRDMQIITHDDVALISRLAIALTDV
ncbi:MAG: hypothetical protein JWM81_72 [Candidatus Saccharibacteria bacterium]|nr:hypothetical protein [Candidatus Saccharibacteria bacterium]